MDRKPVTRGKPGKTVPDARNNIGLTRKVFLLTAGESMGKKGRASSRRKFKGRTLKFTRDYAFSGRAAVTTSYGKRRCFHERNAGRTRMIYKR